MKDYAFDPHQTRSALAAIARLFPLDARLPSGLLALFRLLEQMDLRKVGPWSERLTQADLDRLCHYYDRAPSARALLALLIILVFRKDARAESVMRHFFHMLPQKIDIEDLRALWNEMGLTEVAAGSALWIGRFVEGTGETDLLAYVQNGLKDQTLSYAEILSKVTRATPLINALTDFLFTEGKYLLAHLAPSLATELVQEFLEKGENQKLINFLNFYPDEHWKPEFVETLCRIKGNPDPQQVPFYREVEKGRIWSIRKKLYNARMASASLKAAHIDFWQPWLHRCQSVIREGRSIRILIEPLEILETASRTQVFWARRKQDGPILDLDNSGSWEYQLEEILSEKVEWGYHT